MQVQKRERCENLTEEEEEEEEKEEEEEEEEGYDGQLNWA